MVDKRLEEYLRILREGGCLEGSELYQAQETPVQGLTYESAKAEPGTLFVCKGAAFKKAYLEDALSRGAIAYVSQEDYGIPGIPHILVRDIRQAMPLLARAFYQIPEEDLHCIGITGTKGKTTTAFFLRSIWNAAMERRGGRDIAFLTSLENYDGVTKEASTLTTPEIMEIYRHFRNACDSGISWAVMEVSSQALKYQRVAGIPFAMGIFLNISEDHISPTEHKDFEDYFQSKLTLFGQVKTAIVGLDTPHAQRILQAAGQEDGVERVVTFGQVAEAEVYGHDVEVEEGRLTFAVTCPAFTRRFTLAMHGVFNVENALAAIAAAYVAGIAPEDMQKGLEAARVGGRMEEYTSPDGSVTAIVDYAHNGLSFRTIFEAARLEYPHHRMVAVFGCPGGKAYNRRKDLGTEAGRACSRVYLTADDPEREQVEDICREISQYLDPEQCPWECIPDREEAIRQAIRQAMHGAAYSEAPQAAHQVSHPAGSPASEKAGEKTLVLVLGKGSETSQKIGHKRCPYRSDAVVVQECLGLL